VKKACFKSGKKVVKRGRDHGASSNWNEPQRTLHTQNNSHKPAETQKKGQAKSTRERMRRGTLQSVPLDRGNRGF